MESAFQTKVKLSDLYREIRQKKMPCKKQGIFMSFVAEYYNFTTFAAAGPLAPSTMSNETRAPSSRDLNPSA
jgi:hypothetical protein